MILVLLEEQYNEEENNTDKKDFFLESNKQCIPQDIYTKKYSNNNMNIKRIRVKKILPLKSYPFDTVNISIKSPDNISHDTDMSKLSITNSEESHVIKNVRSKSILLKLDGSTNNTITPVDCLLSIATSLSKVNISHPYLSKNILSPVKVRNEGKSNEEMRLSACTVNSLSSKLLPVELSSIISNKTSFT